jgi:uncharacterized FlaG/YvyC family protein
MASSGNPVQMPATSLVHGSQAQTTVIVQQSNVQQSSVQQSNVQQSNVQSSGKSLPQSGNSAVEAAKNAAAAPRPDLQAQVALLNKYLNDSGRPDEYRVDPASDAKLIQQINPATGAVIGEFSASEFPALARSVGVSGALIDSHA